MIFVLILPSLPSKILILFIFCEDIILHVKSAYILLFNNFNYVFYVLSIDDLLS